MFLCFLSYVWQNPTSDKIKYKLYNAVIFIKLILNTTKLNLITKHM